jgi:hypothetical protein
MPWYEPQRRTSSPSDPLLVCEVTKTMTIGQNRHPIDVEQTMQARPPRESRFGVFETAASGLLGFALHFAEMWIAMLLGMALFGYARSALAALGYRGLLDVGSIQNEVGHGVFMTAPMVLWMRIRGYRWRKNFEMALGMLVPWATLLWLDGFGLLKRVSWLSERGAMATGMLAVMLYHAWANKFEMAGSRESELVPSFRFPTEEDQPESVSLEE